MFVLVVDFLQELNVRLQVPEHPFDVPRVDVAEVPVVLVDFLVQGVDQVFQGVPDVLYILGHSYFVVKVHYLGVLDDLQDL